MILVVGCISPLGNEVCRRLCAEGKRVRALVARDTEAQPLKALQRAGAELMAGDARDPASLAAAYHGVDSVVLTVAAMPQCAAGCGGVPDRQAIRNLVEFAHALGVRRVLAITVPRSFQKDSALLQARDELSDRLERRDTDHTVLCASFVMETWLRPSLGFDHHRGKAAVFGDGTRPVAWISCNDVAEAALGWLGAPGGAAPRQVVLGGPENLSQFEVVRIFEQVSGRGFEVERVEVAALEREYESARDGAARTLAALKLECARGCPMEAGPAARTTVRDYAARVLAGPASAGAA